MAGNDTEQIPQDATVKGGPDFSDLMRVQEDPVATSKTDDLYKVQETGAVATPTTPAKPFELSTEVNDWLAPAREHLEKGADDVQLGIAGSKVMMSSDGEEYANVEAQLNNSAKVKPLPADTPEWIKHTTDVLAPVLEAVPFLQEVAKEAVIPTAGGAAAGSIIPGVGTLAGAGVALEVSSAVSMGRISSGQLYMQLRREGASHDTAKEVSLGAGIVVGALQLGQNWLLAGIAKKAALNAAKSPVVQNTLFNYVKGLYGAVKTTAIVVDTAELQEAAKIGAEALASHLENNPALGPKDIQKRFTETAVNTLLLIGAAHIGGKAVKHAGMFAKSLRLKKADVGAHLEVKAELAAKAIPEESTLKPEQVKEAARKAALDELYPQEKPELKEQIAKEDTRTKSEIERDEAAKQLHSDVKILIDKKNKATKVLRGAVFASRTLSPGERIQAEGDINKLREDAETVQENLKKAQANEATHEVKSREIEKGRLEKVIERTEPSKKKGQQETRLKQSAEGKSPVQTFLDKVRFYFENQDKASEVVANYEENESKGNFNSEEAREDYDAASFIANIDKRNAKGLRKLRIEIEQAYTDARKGKIAQVLEEAKARKDLVDRAKKAVGGSDRTNADTDKLHLPFISEAGVNMTGNYHQMNEVAFNEEPNVGERNKLIEDLNVRPAQDKSEIEHSNNIKMLYGEIAEANKGDISDVKELLRKGRKDNFMLKVYRKAIKLVKLFPQTDANRIYIEYTDKNGSGVDVISANQAVQLHMMLDDEEAAEALIKGNGYGDPELVDLRIFKLQAQIEEQLGNIDPRYLDMMDAYRNEYFKLYGKLSKEVEKDKGYPLNKTEMFSGQLVHDSAEDLTQENFRDTIHQGNAINNRAPGTLKNRTGSTSRVIIPDVDTAFKQYSRQAEHWLAFKSIVKNKIAPIHGSRSLKTQLINQKGIYFVDAWKKQTKDILYGEVNQANQVEKFLDTVIFRNLPFAMVSGKIPLFSAHILASFNMLIDIPADARARGTAKFFEDPIANFNAMLDTPQLKLRHEAHAIDTASNTRYTDNMDSPVSTMWQFFWMSPTLQGIKAEAFGMFVAKEYYMEQGMSEAKALEKAAELVHKTQVSGAIDMRSAMNRGLIGRTLATFHGQQLKLSTQVAVDYTYWIKHKTPEAKAALMRSVGKAIYTGLAFGSVKAIYNYGTAKNDKERNSAIERFITEPIESCFQVLNIPVISTAIEDIAKVTLGIHVSEPSEGLAGQATKAIYNLAKDAQSMKKHPSYLENHPMHVLEDVNAFISFFVKDPFGPAIHAGTKLHK